MNISGGKFVRERERELGTVNGSPSGLQQIRDGNEITGEGVDERVSRTMDDMMSVMAYLPNNGTRFSPWKIAGWES